MCPWGYYRRTRSYRSASVHATFDPCRASEVATYMKMHPVSNHAQLTKMFIQYLNNTLK
ncbi:hypothetical protein DPMN_066452 [Dreissena polymorpha]|uniref:Uncharacterized protein n=1 Tax=Dreissena polymorpha TaxID=45954 RepID=A0A9D4BSX1_DREPO|nr:hypothetical protein DPMN_066452 [Dreissena polymorpha]